MNINKFKEVLNHGVTFFIVSMLCVFSFYVAAYTVAVGVSGGYLILVVGLAGQIAAIFMFAKQLKQSFAKS